MLFAERILFLLWFFLPFSFFPSTSSHLSLSRSSYRQGVKSMTSLELPLARLSISNPRLVPAGASPKSVNWDSYSNCIIKTNVTSDPAFLRLQIVHGSITLIVRDLSVSDSINASVTRRITHIGQQAAFRYDWPLNVGVGAKTQECFQVIFQNVTDLISLLGHLKPFFNLQTSTTKPITVTSSQYAQVQAKKNSSIKKKTPSTPRQKKQVANPTPVTASPKGGLAEATRTVNKPCPNSRPSSASNPRAPEANTLGSSSTSKLRDTDGTVPPMLSPTGLRPVTEDMGRQSPPPAHGPLAFSINDPIVAGLKRKLLAGFDPGTIVPVTMHRPPQIARITGHQSHSEPQTKATSSSHSITHRDDPESITNEGASFNHHSPPTVPVQKPATTPHPPPVDLITFSSPIMSSNPHPPPPGPARIILGGSSDMEIGNECDWPVMLTEEKQREETLKRLVEEDLDVEMNPDDGSAVRKSRSQACIMFIEILKNYFSKQQCWSVPSTNYEPLPMALSLAVNGPASYELSDQKLFELICQIFRDPKFTNLYRKISHILGQVSSAQHHNPYRTPSESYTSLPPFTPRGQSVYSQEYTDQSCHSYPLQNHSNYKRPACSLEYHDDQTIWKRMRVDGEEMYLYDDLEEEDRMC
ncbi:hypothetical protein J010_01525 [Cryptococcus neoformans]|nr:hypothetical protein C355_01653 [Cryptococcus neoformans var. grubii Th84]OXH15777.1 hypothetical protein J010_01525 [Cryptococcus neoformans var. grubii]OXH36073.1 hypothetical protein J009_01537 [Cryptococcus neoformans var. grubii]OXH56869.1 hypothetical protein J003_01543 [Cryptococcus neoformans var. grubii]OXH56983.1 hypothetical protein J004_01578 [Cryptococcus neoformans var. grubii]